MDLSSLHPPRNSRIQCRSDEDGQPVLHWDPPGGKWGRWGAAAFIGLWLCGWFVGEVFALTMLGVMIAGLVGNGMGGFEWFGLIFLLVWLSGWTVGGLAALRVFVQLVRKPRPERVVFGALALIHDPGNPNVFPSGEESSRQGRERHAPFWRSPEPREIPWSELGEIRLERVGERQRLTVDWSAERIEIGSTLGEPEREWLASVLRIWSGQKE
jgi:hypothetical protein